LTTVEDALNALQMSCIVLCNRYGVHTNLAEIELDNPDVPLSDHGQCC